jgi:hypothetical protein
MRRHQTITSAYWYHIAPSYMSPNAGGGGGELRGLSQRVQMYTGAQIDFADLTPYLSYDWYLPSSVTAAKTVLE